MEKIKYSVPRIAALLTIVFLGTLIQQSCSQDNSIGSGFSDDEFIENLSNYE
tara:strand:- start:153 stop:308 length:156 start_codon:yes stop_codon:yes gene_type:complete